MTTINVSENYVDGNPIRARRNLIGESVGLYLQNLLPLFVFAAMAETAFFFADRSADFIRIILYGASGFLWLVAFGSTIHLVGRRCANQKADIIESYFRGLQKIPHLVFAGLFFIVALTISALLSVAIIGIPLFLYLLVAWFFASQAIMIENEGPLSALRRSRELVKGYWWGTFSRILASLLIVSLLLVTSGVGIFFISSSSVGEILGIVISTLTFPIIPLSATLIYLDLRVRHGSGATGLAEREAPVEVVERELPAKVTERVVPIEAAKPEQLAEVVERELPAKVTERVVPIEAAKPEQLAEVVEREAPVEVIEDKTPAEIVEREAPVEVTEPELPGEVNEQEAPSEVTVPVADRWQCMVCEGVYDPAIGDTDRAIAPGTPFEDLPDDWECASCGTSKDWFENVNLKASGEESAFRELRLELESPEELAS